jgi:hypothetical protein
MQAQALATGRSFSQKFIEGLKPRLAIGIVQRLPGCHPRLVGCE